MKKYMTPELSELLFEDVLLGSDLDGLVPDDEIPGAGDNRDEADDEIIID